MSPRPIPRLSSMYAGSMIMLAALLTTPVVAAKANRVDRDAQALATADIAAQIFVVGDGTPASCTQDAIQTQLWAAAAAGGGRILFNCGQSPLTIPINTGTLSLPDNTTLDGSGRITLQAMILSGPSLSVDAGATVGLKNLTIVAGGSLFHAVDNSGSLTVWECAFSGFPSTAIRSRGSLTIVLSTFSNNGSFLSSAVTIESGTGSVRRSVFSNNSSFVGGAINNGGTLDIAGTRFIGNEADPAGGAIGNTGVLTIENSEFTGGAAALDGGAVVNQGSLTVTNSTFANNRGLGPGSGAISGTGTTVIRNCDFLNNLGGAFGGALFVSGDVTIIDSTFSGNHAQVQGGAIYTSADVLTIRRSLILTNRAEGDGGGIFVAAGSVVQHRTIIIDNFPDDIISAAPVLSTAAPSKSTAAPSKSTAAPVSNADPATWNQWLKSQLLFSLTASPQDIAARRAALKQQ